MPALIVLMLRIHYFFDLLRGDAEGAIERDAHAGQQRRQQIALITLDVLQEAARLERAAAFSREECRRRTHARHVRVVSGLLRP